MTGLSIDFFKIGEIITRIEPAMNDFRGRRKKPLEPQADYSYIGYCLKYVGRKNDRIYLRHYSYKKSFKKGRKFSVNYGIFKNGWAYADVSNIIQVTKEPVRNLNKLENINFYHNHFGKMKDNFRYN